MPGRVTRRSIAASGGAPASSVRPPLSISAASAMMLRARIRVNGRDPTGRGSEMSQPGMRRGDRLAERLRESARECRRGPDADLLAEDGARDQLESVERARDAKARVPRDCVGEQWIAAEM